MDIYQYIDNLINRLDSVQVSGVKNMEAIVDVARGLEALKVGIKVEGENHAEDHDQQK